LAQPGRAFQAWERFVIQQVWQALHPTQACLKLKKLHRKKYHDLNAEFLDTLEEVKCCK
jgi:hypothetical protein